MKGWRVGFAAVLFWLVAVEAVYRQQRSGRGVDADPGPR